jgi:cytochrome c5
MEALQTKDNIEFYLILKAAKSSAKSVTVAQQECHLAQLKGAPASGTARNWKTSNIQHSTPNVQVFNSMFDVGR